MTPTLFKKICLLGDFAVGKTSLVRRYVDNQFSDQYLSTVGVKLSRKLIELPMDSGQAIAVQLVLWDLEGKTDFSDSSNSYLRGANGAIIVGDLTRPETVANIKNHVGAFLAVNPCSSIVVAYNKSDLLDEPRLRDELRFEGHERVVKARRTSAKNGENVQSLFAALSKKLIERH